MVNWKIQTLNILLEDYTGISDGLGRLKIHEIIVIVNTSVCYFVFKKKKSQTYRILQREEIRK